MKTFRDFLSEKLSKYELTDETTKVAGKTLYRIRALKSFGTVEAGKLGGFIESEKNLSQDGNAWVYHNAMVYDKAEVSGNAWVGNNAVVSGNAKVKDDAKVKDAMVGGNAVVSGNDVVQVRKSSNEFIQEIKK